MALLQKEKRAFLIAILSITCTELAKQGYTGEKQTGHLLDVLQNVLKGLVGLEKSNPNNKDFVDVELCCLGAKFGLQALIGKVLLPFPNGGILTKQTNDETPKYGGVNDGETVFQKKNSSNTIPDCTTIRYVDSKIDELKRQIAFQNSRIEELTKKVDFFGAYK